MLFCMDVKIGRCNWGRNVVRGCLRIGCWGKYLGLGGKGNREWRKIHNEELNNLYCSPNIVRNGGWIFRKNSTKSATIQSYSYTAVQVTDLNSDYWQTATHIFQQIHLLRQMCDIWKIPPPKAQTPPRRFLFFR